MSGEERDISEFLPKRTGRSREEAAEDFAHLRILESVNETLQDVFGIKGYDLRHMSGARVVDELGAEVEGGFVCRHRGEYFEVKNGEKIPLEPYCIYILTDMHDVLAALVAVEEAYELHLDKAHDALVKDRARILRMLEKVAPAKQILKEASARWPRISGLVYHGRHVGMEFVNLCLLKSILPIVEGRCRRKSEHRIDRARRGITVRHRTSADIIEFEEMVQPHVEHTLEEIKATLDERMREWMDKLRAWKSKSEAG